MQGKILKIILLCLFFGIDTLSGAPVRSYGNPSGELRGTNTAILSVFTDEPAVCRYAASPSIPYSSMTSTFTQAGGQYHRQTIYNLQNNGSYAYCIRCRSVDDYSENSDDYTVNFSVIADSAPGAGNGITINSVAGTAADGSLLTVEGGGFGAREASVLIFDDFEGGTAAAAIPLTSPAVGSWDGVNSNPPTYSTCAFSGQFAMRIRDELSMQQFNKLFTEPVRELYASYWVRIPDGTNFPGAAGPGVLPDFSAWKMIWIFNGPEGYASPNNDLCLPTFSSSFILSGNDSLLTWVGNAFWTFSRYMRMSTWLKANGTDPLLPGNVRFQVFQDGAGLARFMDRTDIPLYDADDPTPEDGDYYCTHNGFETPWCLPDQPKQWDRMTVPGWLLPNGDSRRPESGDPAKEMPAYDDFYIAIGTGAQARVEVGNAPTYAGCTRITLATPESWSDNTITARFRRGSMQGGSAWLYVIDGNGNVNTSGFPITVYSTPDLTPPQIPSNLIIK